MAQFALMAGIGAAWFVPPGWPDDAQLPLAIVGGVLAGLGLGLALWAHRSLGAAFTTYTHPPQGAGRVETGPYRLARHPMYGGGILVFAGISLAFGVVSLLVTVVLALLWRAKSAAEERVLVARFPDYATYRERTRRRFWPGI